MSSIELSWTAKKYTSLKKVHHRRLWQLWLIWAVVMNVCFLFVHSCYVLLFWLIFGHFGAGVRILLFMNRKCEYCVDHSELFWEKQENMYWHFKHIGSREVRRKIGWNVSLQIKKFCLLPNSNNIPPKRPIKGPGIKRSTDRVTELSNKNQYDRQLSSFKG